MSVAQFTLCGAESKWLIAHCVSESGLLAPYLETGRILFKGSSTVSCLTKLLADTPMRICGRISKNGMKGPFQPSDGAHFLLYEQGTLRNVDQCIESTAKDLGPKDLFVTGANALDSFGHAALLIGSPGGGGYGSCMPSLYTEGVRTLILSSIAKLVPGDLSVLYTKVSRKDCDFSYGMACSLTPIPGEIITETQAIQAFADVEALVFAKGGGSGAEDAVACQIRGEQDQVEKVLSLVEQVKALPPGPLAEVGSEPECMFPCASCAQHRSCAYANKQKIFHRIQPK